MWHKLSNAKKILYKTDNLSIHLDLTITILKKSLSPWAASIQSGIMKWCPSTLALKVRPISELQITVGNRTLACVRGNPNCDQTWYLDNIFLSKVVLWQGWRKNLPWVLEHPILGDFLPQFILFDQDRVLIGYISFQEKKLFAVLHIQPCFL